MENIKSLPEEAGMFNWTVSGRLGLELIKKEIEGNSPLQYAKELYGSSPRFTSFVVEMQRINTAKKSFL